MHLHRLLFSWLYHQENDTLPIDFLGGVLKSCYNVIRIHRKSVDYWIVTKEADNIPLPEINVLYKTKEHLRLKQLNNRWKELKPPKGITNVTPVINVNWTT